MSLEHWLRIEWLQPCEPTLPEIGAASSRRSGTVRRPCQRHERTGSSSTPMPRACNCVWSRSVPPDAKCPKVDLGIRGNRFFAVYPGGRLGGTRPITSNAVRDREARRCMNASTL